MPCPVPRVAPLSPIDSQVSRLWATVALQDACKALLEEAPRVLLQSELAFRKEPLAALSVVVSDHSN